MDKRITQTGAVAVLAILGVSVAFVAESLGLPPTMIDKTELDKLAGQPVDIAPWAYAWRADLAVQEKPEANSIPRRLERMDKVYRTAFCEMPAQELKSKCYEMPDLLKPLLPKPKGQLQAGLLWTERLEDYQVEYEQQIIKAVRGMGVPVIFHNCGDAAKVMHLYNDLDISCWGYLTPPPFGDVDLDEALRVMRPDMALRGNVDQVEFLMKATPKEVKGRVRSLLFKVKPRGNWILSTTDFFFDGTPYQNIEAFAEAGREHGEY